MPRMPAYTRRRIASAALLVVGLGLTAAGCGSTEPKVPTSAAVSASSLSFSTIGRTAQLTATITDQHGDAIASPALTWTSSDGAVATVTADGVVTAAGNGSATITVAAGSASAQVSITVAQTPEQMQKVAGDGQTATPGQPV